MTHRPDNTLVVRRERGNPLWILNNLHRDDIEGEIGGVCAGTAKTLGIPTWVVRAAFLVAFFGYGTGVLLYVLMWALLPERSVLMLPAGAPSLPKLPPKKEPTPDDLSPGDREIWDAVKKDMDSLGLSDD